MKPTVSKLGLGTIALALLCANPLAQTVDPSLGNESAAKGDNDQDSIGAAPTVTEALQGKSGLRIQTLCTHCNSANLQVGGLSQDLVPLTRDGSPVVGGLAAALILNFLPADSIAAATIVKGPGDARLSNVAAGGEVRLTPATPDELPWLEHVAEGGSFGLFRSTTRLTGSPTSWASGSIVFGHTEADAVDDDRDGWNDVPAVERRVAEGDLTLLPALGHTIRLGASFIDEDNLDGRGGFDAFRFITEGEDSWTREDARFQRRELRGQWGHDLRSGGKIELRLMDARRRQRQTSQLTAIDVGFIEGANRFLPRFRIEEDVRWAGFNYRRPLGLQFRVDGGLEASSQDVDAVNIEPLDALTGSEPQPELALEAVDMTSGYVDVGWTPGPAWDLQIGVRQDKARLLTRITQVTSTTTRRSFSETSPRATLRYYPTRNITLRFLAGRTYRPPKPILAEVCCGQRYQTTEAVVPERAHTVGLEASFVPNPRFALGVYLARTDFDDHLLRVAGFSQVFTQTYALTNVPEARAERAELTLGWSPTRRLTLDGSVNWLSFKNRGESVIGVAVAPPSFGGTAIVPIQIERIPYQPVRAGTLSAKLALPRDAMISAQAGYTGSMPIQQFTRLPLNSELDTTTLRMTPGFWLVNLSAQIPLRAGLTGLLTVDNVTDRLQSDLNDPTTDFNWGPLAGRSFRAGLRFTPKR